MARMRILRDAGIPRERCFAILRWHLHAWQMGKTDEDYLVAACNLMFIIHYEEVVRRGLLPAELDDMLEYGAGAGSG